MVNLHFTGSVKSMWNLASYETMKEYIIYPCVYLHEVLKGNPKDPLNSCEFQQENIAHV